MFRPREALARTAWVSSLVLVMALHLLSTGGTWWVTDHGEILLVADRFLASGRFDLAELGEGWEDWEQIVAARGNTRTRFLPLSVLSLTPFLIVDHALGLRSAAEFKVVHLQGHFFVGLALFIVGRFVARSAGQGIAALAILLVGLVWPVWMIARRLGPEPVLLFLMVAFVVGGSRIRFLCLLALPWLHATGPLLGGCALLWLAVTEKTPRVRDLAIGGAGWAIGVASLVLLWNIPVHGSAFLGGYGAFAAGQTLGVRNPLQGLFALLAPMLLWTAPLWLLTPRADRRSLLQTLALWFPALSFFALLYHPGLLPTAEPARRLAPLLAPTTILIMTRMKALPGNAMVGLAVMALASGVVGLSMDFVATIETPLGLFSGPHLLWVRLAFQEGRPLLAGIIVLGLVAIAIVSASRTLRLLLEPGIAVGSDGVPDAELSS